MIGFSGSATPGFEFMPCSRRRSGTSFSRSIAATTMKLDCGVMTPGSLRLAEVQAEVDQALLLPVDLAQVEAGLDLTNLVPNPVRQQGRLRVIQDDAFLLVEPTRVLINFRDDRIQPKRCDAVCEDAVLAVEGLPLPGEMADHLGYFRD